MTIDLLYTLTPQQDTLTPQQARAAAGDDEYQRRQALVQFVRVFDQIWPSILQLASGELKDAAKAARAIELVAQHASAMSKKWGGSSGSAYVPADAVRDVLKVREEKEEGKWKLHVEQMQPTIGKAEIVDGGPSEGPVTRRLKLAKIDVVKVRAAFPSLR